MTRYMHTFTLLLGKDFPISTAFISLSMEPNSDFEPLEIKIILCNSERVITSQKFWFFTIIY